MEKLSCYKYNTDKCHFVNIHNRFYVRWDNLFGVKKWGIKSKKEKREEMIKNGHRGRKESLIQSICSFSCQLKYETVLC